MPIRQKTLIERFRLRPLGNINAPPRDKGPKFRRKVNVPLLIATAAALLVILPAAYFWHDYQVGRLSDALLRRADRLEEEGNGALEADYLQRFLRLHPEDFTATVRLAKLLERTTADPQAKSRASSAYLRAVALLSPEEQVSESAFDLRMRIAELSLEGRRYRLSQEQAGLVLKQNPRHASALRVRALALHAQFETSKELASAVEVQQALEAALAAQPESIELATKLAYFYREETAESRTDSADQLVDRLVQQNPESAEAHLARYHYRSRYGYGSEADAAHDLERALECDPEDLAVLTAAAEQAHERETSLEAEKYYARMIEVAPEVAEGYLGLARMCASRGDHSAAVEVLQDARTRVVGSPLAIELTLAELHLAAQQLDKLDQALQAAKAIYDKHRHELLRSDRITVENAFALLRAQWEIGRGKPSAAISHLTQVAATQATGQEARQDTEGRSRALVLLGKAHGELDQWDQAALAYEHAASLQPHLPNLLVSAALCWTNARQPEAAIRCYRQALTLQDRPELWGGLAEVLFQREMSQLPAERDWKAFKEAMDRAAQDTELAASLCILEARYELVREAPSSPAPEARQRAVALLKQAEQRQSPSAQFWQDLVLTYERLGQEADADRVSKRLQMDNRAEAAIFDAQRQLTRGDFNAAQHVLTEALPTVSAEERTALRHALSDLLGSLGQITDARQQLLKIRAEDADDREALVALLELALRTGNFDEVQQWEESLRKLDQNHAAEWRFYRAARLALQSAGSHGPELDEAEQLQRLVESERPAWPSSHLLKALIYQRREKSSQAIESYQAAIRLGEPRLLAHQRLITLLHQTQRFTEAQSLLARLQQHVPSSQNLSALAISGSLQLDQLGQAIRWAELRTEQQPADATGWLWLGQLYVATDDPGQAETALKKAVETAPQDRRARSALFAYYVQMGKRTAAAEQLQKLVELTEGTDAQRALVAAQGYALLGEEELARRSYDQAMELAPGDVQGRLLAAQFYMARDPSRAEQMLRDTLRRDPKSATARRLLGGLLMQRGGQEAFAEALELLSKSAPKSEDWVRDQRLRAIALAQRGALAQAQRALEVISESGSPLVAGDRMLLARLYELLGDVSAAREQYLSIGRSGDVEPLHLAAFAQFLIRHKEAGEAHPWVEQLDRLAPGSWLAVSCRARLWHSQGQIAKVRTLLSGYLEQSLEKAGQDAQKEQLLSLIGALYGDLELHSEAEGTYRRLLAHAPERYDLLASSLARQDRLRDAVTVCVEAAESDPSARGSIVLATLLAAEQAQLKDYPAAHALLQRAEKTHPDNAQLIFAVAQAHLVSGETEETICLYEQMLHVNPRHVAALNNLAVLLAERGDEQQAIVYADRALDVAGLSQPDLLDTKAMILLQQGDHAEALRLLEQAVRLANPDPRHLLHLAYAHHKLGAQDEARRVLGKAQESDLDGTLLASIDRDWLRTLQQALQQ